MRCFGMIFPTQFEESMDAEKARYVVRYYCQLMTTPELVAHRHLLGKAKATRGRTDAVAQREAAPAEPHILGHLDRGAALGHRKAALGHQSRA
jgi:hypothetical protein